MMLWPGLNGTNFENLDCFGNVRKTCINAENDKYKVEFARVLGSLDDAPEDQIGFDAPLGCGCAVS